MTIITPEMVARSSEHSQQTAIFVWASQSGIAELKWMFAIPNGGLRDARTAGKLKAEGVKPGVPDIMLPVTSVKAQDGFCYFGLFIEMKVGRNKPQIEQQEYIEFLRAQGYKCVVCHNWTAARDVILQYLRK